MEKLTSPVEKGYSPIIKICSPIEKNYSPIEKKRYPVCKKITFISRMLYGVTRKRKGGYWRRERVIGGGVVGCGRIIQGCTQPDLKTILLPS
ncbi:MAG: hypothetical protein RBT74_12405 [Tenuifilaceae bacterium]|nr:hypothetical protein [Tenuifilaceae bacterium]